MNRNQSESGFSLVELMVAIVVGMVMVVALSYVFVSGRQASRVHGGVSRMQEDGRYALFLMGRAIQQAGAAGSLGPLAGDALAGVDGGESGTDSITLRYVAQDGGEVDCTGTDIPLEKDPSIVTVVYRFSVSNDTLFCSNGTQVQPIVEGVEDLQIQYGSIDTNTGNTTYADAASDDAVAVRVSLRLRSDSSGLATNKQTYSMPDADKPVIAPDYRLRQVYSATFVLRNRIHR